MAFTRSLLIKALGGVAGVSGTTVGVLAGTGVFDRKETNTPPKAPVDSEIPSGAAKPEEGGTSNQVTTGDGATDRNAVDTNHQDVGRREGQGGNESLDSTKPGDGGEVDNKAGKGSTEQEGSDAVSQKGQTGDKTQKVDSSLPKDAQENNKGNTQQNSQPGVQTAQGGGGEHSPGSTSKISEPGSSGSQVEGAGNVDPKPQSAATTTPQAEEKQKSSVVNTGVTGPQQSIPTIQESPDRDSDGQPGGNNGDSNLPNVVDTPGSTGDNGADGGGSLRSPDSPATDSPTQSKEEKINAKLKTLDVPESCNFSQNETTKTCQISEKELKKIKFEESGDEESTSDSETKNIQLKIEILSGNKKTAYGINNGDEEESDVTKDLLFTFSGFNNEINLDSDDAFKIYPNTNPEFKVEGSELEKLWVKHSDLTGKVGINKKDNSSSYAFESTTTLKYSLDGTEEGIKTLNSPTTSGTIRVEGDKENYNQGVKVNFSAKITGTEGDNSQSVTLESGDYEIKYKDGDNEGWYLSKKNEGTEGKTKGIQGADGRGADTTDPNSVNSQQPPQSDGSHSPNELSSGQQLNNNQQEQVPTEDTNSLPKTDASDSDTSDTNDDEGEEIDTATDQQVKETNIKLKELKIPKKCRFTDNNKDEPLECSLTNKEFSEINFANPEESDEEANDTFKAKLLIEILKGKKKTDYENDLLFTLKDYTQTIKIEDDDDLLVNTNPEFKISGSELTLFWDQTIYKLAEKLQLSLASGGAYNLEEEKTIKFSLGSDKEIKELKATTKITEIASNGGVVVDGESETKGAANYNQGFKYVVHQDVTGEEGNTLKAGNYEIKYDETEGWYLSLVEPKVTQPTTGGQLTQ